MKLVYACEERREHRRRAAQCRATGQYGAEQAARVGAPATRAPAESGESTYSFYISYINSIAGVL